MHGYSAGTLYRVCGGDICTGALRTTEVGGQATNFCACSKSLHTKKACIARVCTVTIRSVRFRTDHQTFGRVAIAPCPHIRVTGSSSVCKQIPQSSCESLPVLRGLSISVVSTVSSMIFFSRMFTASVCSIENGALQDGHLQRGPLQRQALVSTFIAITCRHWRQRVRCTL